MRNPFYKYKVGPYTKRYQFFITGVGSIIDGIITVLTFGFIGTSLKLDLTGLFLKKELNKAINKETKRIDW